MTISHLLAPIPKWVIIGNDGKTAGGAKMYTRSNLVKTADKAVYQDPAGTIPYTNPIIFDATGTQGPFYWETDSDNLDDTYYLEIYDSDDTLLFTLENYFPPGSGGGGGGSSTTYVDTKNYLVNNLFWRNYSDDDVVTNKTNVVIAPGAHSALTEVTNATNGSTGPDIRFIKSGTLSTDRIRFVEFNAGEDPFVNDVTPGYSLRFTCTSAGGESYKYIQFPVMRNVRLLDNQTMTFVMWAKTQSGTANVNVDFRQYFGASGGAADVFSSSSTLALTTTWTRFVKTLVIPSALGVRGECRDDALYFRISLPTAETDLYLAKPALYLGNISPGAELDTFDEIDSIINSPRTGDVVTSWRSSAPLGYMSFSDTTSIGHPGSAATRANYDTFPLYKELYLNIADIYAPVSGGRTGSTIATCIADYVNNKTLTFPRVLGRSLAAAGAGTGLTNRPLGAYIGTETISISDMPAHNHPGSTISPANIENYCGNGTKSTFNTTLGAGSTALNIASQGGSAADGKMQPTSFFNVFIKL